MKHYENSANHYENSVHHYENSANHYENSVKHYENRLNVEHLVRGVSCGKLGSQSKFNLGTSTGHF